MVVLPPEDFELPSVWALLTFWLEYSEVAFDFTVELDFETFVCLETV